MELEAPQARRAEVDEKPGDDADRAQNLRARVHQVHGFGVHGVDAEESRRKEREERVQGPGRGAVHDPKVEEEERGAENQEKEELVEVKDAGRQAVAEKVIDGEAERDEGAVVLVLGKRARRPDIGEEPPRVREVADVEVVHDDVAVVEVKRVAEDVRVGREEKEKAAAGRQEERTGQAGPAAARRLGHRALQRCWRPGSFWTSSTTA